MYPSHMLLKINTKYRDPEMNTSIKGRPHIETKESGGLIKDKKRKY